MIVGFFFDNFNISDKKRNTFQLFGAQAKCGYDWWWHSFIAHNKETNEEKAFFIELFLCNPEYGNDKPIFGQLPENKKNKIKPSYLIVKVGTWGDDARQLHRFFGWNEIKVDKGCPFKIEADNCYLDEIFTKGEVSVSKTDACIHPEWMSDAGTFHGI